MKLTKGALTMLLAQYRAIYKNAFIKGLASAALATAVLASGSASAGDIKDEQVTGGVLTISKNDVTANGDDSSLPADTKEIVIEKTGVLTVTKKSPSGTKEALDLTGLDKFEIQSGGVADNLVVGGATDVMALTINAKQSNLAGKVKVDKTGTLTLNGTISSLSGEITNSNVLNINTKTTNISELTIKSGADAKKTTTITSDNVSISGETNALTIGEKSEVKVVAKQVNIDGKITTTKDGASSGQVDGTLVFEGEGTKPTELGHLTTTKNAVIDNKSKISFTNYIADLSKATLSGDGLIEIGASNEVTLAETQLKGITNKIKLEGGAANSGSTINILTDNLNGLVLDKIIVADGKDGIFLGTNGGTIKSDKITVEAQLANGAAGNKKLNLDTNELTIGKTDVAVATDLKISQATVHNKLNILGNAASNLLNNYVLDGSVTDGVISSEHQINIGKSDATGGNLTIANGVWTANNDIKLDSDGNTGTNKGSMSITANAKEQKAGTFKLSDGKKLELNKATVLSVGATTGASADYQATLDLTSGEVVNTSQGKIKIDKFGNVNISEANLKNLTEKGSVELAGDATSKLIIKDGNTLGNLTLSESAGKDKVFANTFKGTVQGKDLTIDKIANGDLAIEGNSTTDSVIEFASAKFETVSTVSGADIKATLKKASLNVSDSVSVTNGGEFGALVLGDTANTGSGADLNLNGNGTLEVSKLILGQDSNLNVKKGEWLFADKADVELAKANIITGENAKLSSLGSLVSSNTSKVTLGENSNLEFGRLNVSGGTLTVTGDANSFLTINGTTEQSGGKDVADITLTGGLAINQGGYVVIGKDAVGDLISADGKVTDTQKTTLDKISADGAGTLKLVLDKTTSFDATTLKALKEALGADFKGFVNLGNATVTGGMVEADKDTGRYHWTAPSGSTTGALGVKDLAQMQFTNNALESGVIEVTATDATTGELKGSFGSFYQKKGKANLSLQGNTSLSNAKANGNMFIADENAAGKVSVGSADVKGGMTLSLKNGGEIKDVKLQAGAKLGVFNTADSTTILNDVKKSAASADALFVGGNVVAHDVDVTDASFENVKDAKLNKLSTREFDTENSTVTVADNVAIAISDKNQNSSILDGDFVAGKDFTVTGTDATKSSSLLVANDGHFEVKGNLVADKDYSINLGNKLEARNAEDPLKKSSATMFVQNTDKFTGTLNLTSGDGKATLAVLGVNNHKLTDIMTPEEANKQEEANKPKVANMLVREQAEQPKPVAAFNTYTLKHTANVGADSVVAYGFNSFDAAVAELENAKLLTKDHRLGNGASAVAMFNVSTKIDNTTTAKGSINLNSDEKLNNKGTVKLGANSVLAFTDKAFISTSGKKDAIALNSTSGGSVVLDKVDGKDVKAKVVLAGDFSAQDKNLHILSGDLKLASGSTLDVESVNGLLVGTLTDTGILEKLTVNDKAVDALRASYPVKQYILKFAKNEAEFTKKNADTKLNELAQRMALGDTGVAIEQSARFAVYGGSVKAAELASKAGTDAIKSYTKGTANVATAQTATGSIFVVPTYKSSDSDSFNAEGVDFGSDIKLSGVALGADYMVAPNVKVGAMFNIGTGDADGKGIASGFETDLDYVGGGLFLNYNQDALNITADLTYTQSSADMKANVVGVVDANKMTADVDTKAISLGVQGAYKFDLDGSYATPYAGMRLTKYDIDSYTVQVDGKSFMNNDADTMTVFSIPVGVELGTQMTAGDWTVEPSLDLGVTFNLGDTDLTHSATAVTKTSGVNLTSEVLDDVVFGIKGALKANYNGLTLGLGLGYEVGSNADDLSVQATGVYTF